MSEPESPPPYESDGRAGADRLVVPVGVDMRPDPELKPYVGLTRVASEEPGGADEFVIKHNGVLVPFNTPEYYRRGEVMAGTDGNRHLDVMGAGISRLVVEARGVEQLRKILAGQGTAEQAAFLRKLLRLERIQGCVVLGTAEVLGFQNMGDFFFSTQVMRDEEAVRDRFLQWIQFFIDKLQELIEFFGDHISVKGGFVKSLPERLRTTVKLNGAPGGEMGELLYVLSEAALILEMVLERGSKYATHEGSEKAPTSEGGPKKITECLKATVMRCLTLSPQIAVSHMNHVAAHWVVTEKLNGAAFSGSRRYGDDRSDGNAIVVDPYSLDLSQVDGKDSKTPQRVPCIPVLEAWVDNRLTDSGGGVAHGRTRRVVKGWMNPTLAQYVKTAIAQREHEGILRILFDPVKYESLTGWTRIVAEKDGDTVGVIPDQFEFADYKKLVELACNDLGLTSLRYINDPRVLPY